MKDGVGQVHGFLLKDGHVAGHIRDMLDALSKDSGGRQRFEVEIEDKEGS